MTAATLSRSPLSVGAAVAGPVARASYWTLSQFIDFGSWAISQFRRAPLAISLITAAAGFSLLAGSNALFLQASHHPAPLFFSAPHQAGPVTPEVRPVVPAVRPRAQPTLDNQTTGSLGSAIVMPDAIDSNDIMALQKKLAGLKFFDGAPDGLFGRRTASAIKAFEQHTGRAPRGKLTREILTAVLSTSPVAEPMPPPAVVASTTNRPGTVVPLAPVRPVAGQSVAVASLSTAAAPVISPNAVADTLPLATSEPPQAATQPSAAPAAAIVPAADTNTIAMNSLPPAPAGNAAAPASAAAAATATVVASIPTTGPTPTTSAAQKLAAQMGTLPATVQTAIATPLPISTDDNASTDPALISKIQQALASLGFLGNNIDGLPGEATAKAIRSFQVFYDYPVTGQASPQLLDLLIQHGATI